MASGALSNAASPGTSSIDSHIHAVRRRTLRDSLGGRHERAASRFTEYWAPSNAAPRRSVASLNAAYARKSSINSQGAKPHRQRTRRRGTSRIGFRRLGSRQCGACRSGVALGMVMRPSQVWLSAVRLSELRLSAVRPLAGWCSSQRQCDHQWCSSSRRCRS